MKKYIAVVMLLLIPFHWVAAQQYFSKSGKIKFTSKAPLEVIEASNTSANIVDDASNGSFEGAVLIKGFQFKKALMQQHFNENYLESHKYPKATFKGHLVNHTSINLEKDGTYQADVKGSLTLHGVTQPFSTTGTVTVKGGKINVASTFDLTVADYHITIPKVVQDNISKTVNVRLSADLQKLVTK